MKIAFSETLFTQRADKKLMQSKKCPVIALVSEDVRQVQKHHALTQVFGCLSVCRHKNEWNEWKFTKKLMSNWNANKILEIDCRLRSGSIFGNELNEYFRQLLIDLIDGQNMSDRLGRFGSIWLFWGTP